MRVFFHNLFENISETWSDVFIVLIPPFTILCVFAFFSVFIIRILTGSFSQSIPPHTWSFLAAFALIGLIPGIVAGYSQDGISGTFLTATVGIVSAMLSYAFAQSALKDYKSLIPYLIIATLIGALVGYGSGGVSKNRWLIYDQQVRRADVIAEQVSQVDLKRREENLKRLIKSKPKGFITAAELEATNVHVGPNDPEKN